MTINNTKKSFSEVVAFLEASKNKKVATILPMIYEMTKAKNQAKTSFELGGQVVAIYCYYHKQWEILADVDYGLKASSSTGWNTMCKVGVNLWTKQNRNVKQVGNIIIDMLEAGELGTNDIADKKAELLALARVLDDTNKPIGFDTIDDVRSELESRK